MINDLLTKILGRDKHYQRYKSLKDTKGAEQHGIAIKSALNAVNAYAVWASLEELFSCNLVTGCAILLPEFRDEACEFFRVISLRNRPVDAVPGYDVAMNFILEQLERASVLATPDAVVGMTVCADYMRKKKVQVDCGDTATLPSPPSPSPSYI